MSDYPVIVKNLSYKCPAELGYKATSLANNANLFPFQGRNITISYEINTLSPLFYQSPAFEKSPPIICRQNHSPRMILKKGLESAKQN